MIELLLYPISLLIIYIILKFRLEISKKLKIIDIPDGYRKLHKLPVPLVGSFPIAISLILCFPIFSVEFQPVMILSLIFFFIGLIDDKYNLDHNKKFIYFFIILLIFYLINPEFLIKSIFFQTLNLKITLINIHSIFFSILCLTLLINAYNFTDGINGLASLIAIIWLLTINLIILDNPKFYINVLVFCIFFNLAGIYRGKYFLGDSGTLMISSLIGTETILMNNAVEVSCESIFIIFMFPGFDLLRLFITRLVKKRNPFLPDRNHFHHLLMKKFSLPNTLIIYSLIIIIPIILDQIFNINQIGIILVSLFIYCISIFSLKKN